MRGSVMAIGPRGDVQPLVALAAALGGRNAGEDGVAQEVENIERAGAMAE